jgi:hypothetical protein
MLILNFTYLLRCLRVPPVEYHWARQWDDRGSNPGEGMGVFLFDTASRPALGSTQPPTQWVLGPLSLGVKWPGREANHSPPSSAEVKEYVEL